MLDSLFDSFTALAGQWRSRAADRRTVTPDDPAAHALMFCAGALDDAVRELRDGTTRLTVNQYASLVVTSPASVRRWIRKGELQAEQDAKGEWHIPRHARRKLPPRVRRRARGIRNEIARDRAEAVTG